MISASRLGKQIAEVCSVLNSADARWALIGGLALASHNVIRATQDVDLLIDLEKADTVHAELLKLGYRCLHRSSDAGNYQRSDERVDFLYASRPIARRLLADAREVKTSLGDLRVITLEGLIGFKLQGLVNDPRRTQDMEGALFSMNSLTKSGEQPFVGEGGITTPAVPLDDPYRALDELMAVVEALCPVWPQRRTFTGKEWMLL